MTLQFPKGFLWGTSTAAAQVETAFDHQWKDFPSKDGYRLNRTTEHELHREEDAKYIKQFGSYYRCGVDWSRLQRSAFGSFETEVVEEYRAFFQLLNDQGTQVMFVLHHFSNPLWFENNKGGWLEEGNIEAFVDFAKKCIQHFGQYVFNWNTFNEPNVYAMNAYMLGNFPPQHKSFFQANRVLKHMGMAHDIVYELIKEKYPDHPIGISLNTAWFKPANILGQIPARFTDWWFHRFAAQFFEKVDYWGLSYYAYILFNPIAITEIDHPGKLAQMGVPHDKMWGYQPEGLARILRRFHKLYKKPIIITENGICTDDAQRRINCLKDYLKICHEAIQDGIDLRGYTHWSTWDNFEWHLGPTYRFGLVHIDLETMERTMTEAGEFYSTITRENAITI